ncbi:MAG: protein translocase subunit SecF [Chloroflexi bacterium]|nr:protein translocase subunit SecF [Chloroflexota bacterium]
MIDIVGKRHIFYIISLALILPGVISLLIPPGLRLAVDFTGGTLWELRFEQTVAPGEVRDVLGEFEYGDAIVQTTGDRGVLIRAKEIRAEDDGKAAIVVRLTERFGRFEELRFETVGPIVSQEIAARALAAVGLASVAILLFVAWAFRSVEHAVRYGVCAIIALLHDALLVLGMFSILGKLYFVEVDSLFVTAMLTVIGFSVHDTIVVFDRIRENVRRYNNLPFDVVANHSIMQTIGRSMTTSLTAAFTLLALIIFGGITTKLFALTLLAGMISGTYSSVFNAAALLVSWEKGELARLAFWRRRNRVMASTT